MNILLVDDESYVIDSIIQKIDWDQYKFQHIFTAHNVRQAKQLLRQHSVEVIICDIVMPQGSGFDLLEWARQQDMAMQTIFLTSYAEFDYAARAIKLESIDYLLKPINAEQLAAALDKAYQRLIQNAKYSDEYQRWHKSKQQIYESALQEIISKPLRERRHIDRYMTENGVDLTCDDIFLPVLVHIYDENTKKTDYRAELRHFFQAGRVNQADEILICQDEMFYYVVCKPGAGFHKEALEALGYDFVLELRERDANACFCTGTESTLDQLPRTVERLRSLRECNLNTWGLAHMTDWTVNDVSYHSPNIDLWRVILREQNRESLLHMIDEYLSTLEQEGCVSLESLKKFRLDIVQLVYTYLEEREVQAHLLFGDTESEHIYRQAVSCIAGATHFALFYVDKAWRQISFVSASRSVVDTLLHYIDTHYQEEINRNDLGTMVYLNVDYISRIFKKETGYSISAYIMHKRVEIAKELLTGTNMPVNSVSLAVGYSNFSYFTKMFRENTDTTPIEFRKNNKPNSGDSASTLQQR